MCHLHDGHPCAPFNACSSHREFVQTLRSSSQQVMLAPRSSVNLYASLHAICLCACTVVRALSSFSLHVSSLPSFVDRVVTSIVQSSASLIKESSSVILQFTSDIRHQLDSRFCKSSDIVFAIYIYM